MPVIMAAGLCQDRAARMPALMPAAWLLQVGMAITQLPEGFNPHRLIKKVYQQRREMVDSGEGVDWAMAEALAFGTLLSEGGRPAPPL